MPSTGLTLAGTGAASGTGQIWASPGNITASDDSYAVATLTKTNTTTQNLDATNFGFALPAGATIDGIEVRIERSAGNTCKDLLVQLIKGGTAQGDDKADTGTNWPSTDTNADYGGSTDLWGISLSESDIEASDFGVTVRAQHVSGVLVADVDAIWINVHYTEAGGGLLIPVAMYEYRQRHQSVV